MYAVLSVLCVLPSLVLVQVLRIHFEEGDALRERGARQVNAIELIPAKRGSILDQAGRVLVVNTGRYDLALDPMMSGFTPAVSKMFFDRLSAITGRPAASFRRKVNDRSSPRYVSLMRDMTEEQKEAVEALDVPGVILHPRFNRRYNYGSIAAHILGYVDSDGHGIAGLELQYEEYLWGEPGKRVARRDRRGVLKASVEDPIAEPRDGESIVLTIDLIRQTIVEEELARGLQEMGANWGTAIAMDPRTGAIMAMANAPSFDPNRPNEFRTEIHRNHAVTDRVEPGSTFKLVTAIAAVEREIVDLQDTVDTGQGYGVFGGRTMRDSRGYGRISFAEVIALSSNVGVAMTASRLPQGALYQYARSLGFGQPTWIDLPGEVSGRLKRPAQWSATSPTSISIGYEVDATPLQLLTAYAALANGGLLVRPHIVSERMDVAGRVVWRAEPDSVRRAFKAQTRDRVLPAFELAVEEGTAKRARVEGLRIAGKTGTAIKVSGGSYQRGAHRATFVGFFPVEDPAVVMLVMLDEPRHGGYGGTASAPIFQRIASRWIGTLPEVGQRMAPEDSLRARPLVSVPSVEGQTLAVAEDLVRARGLTPRRDASAPISLVSASLPAPPAPLERGESVRLVARDADSSRTMPDVRGLSARQALFTLSARGISVRLDGSGVVIRQSISPGDPLPEEVSLTCR